MSCEEDVEFVWGTKVSHCGPDMTRTFHSWLRCPTGEVSRNYILLTLCKPPLYSSLWKLLLISSLLISTSHYSMLQKSHERWETWQESAAERGGSKQSRACAASSDSIGAPVKDLVCLPRLSEAWPARERDRERVTEQREENRERRMKQNTELREMRQSSDSLTQPWWHEDLINYPFIWMWSQLFDKASSLLWRYSSYLAYKLILVILNVRDRDECKPVCAASCAN